MAALEARTGVVADFAAFAPDRTLQDIAVALARGPEGGAGLAVDSVAPATALIARDLVLSRHDVPLVLAQRRPPARLAENIFLTGATGFLGGRIAAELLGRTKADIHCLVRGENDVAAAQRLRVSLMQAGLPDTAAAVGGRLRAVAGDIEAPLFGMDSDRFHDFAEQLDAVYHNAAKVSFVASYADLRTSIVEGTRQALMLAGQGRRKTLHYVSTVAVFMTEMLLGVPLVSEDELPETCEDALYGYTQAKWTSERLIRTARDRGLDVSVYRPGNITGDSRTGYWAVGDAFTRLLAATGAAASLPAIAATVDLTPVDFVASAMVALSLSKRAQGLTHHLVHPSPMSFDEFVATATGMGFALARVPYKEWVERVAAVARAKPDHPAAAVVPLLTARRGRSGLTMLELLAFRPGTATERTLRLAAEAGVMPPPVDAALIRRYLSYLEKAGYGPWRLGAAA
jgi:thioester reductase-like protein